jgi:hypothetical protein
LAYDSIQHESEHIANKRNMVHRNIYSHTLILFSCLTVVLLSKEQANIPVRDLIASALLAVAVGLLIAGVRITGVVSHDVKKQASPPAPPESFQRSSKRLMQLEVIWTLFVPWILLFLDKMYDFHLLEDPHEKLTVAYLVTPHLFFFQVQIILEAVLVVAKCQSFLFLYTAAANAYRALPLGTCILRSLLTLVTMPLYSANDWFVVVVLPCVATCLWLYSSLIFLPLEWYPVVSNVERM